MNRAKTTAAAAFCVLAATLTVPAAAAHAGGTKDPQYSPSANSCADRSAYTGSWSAHSSTVVLNPNGSGSIQFRNGAPNVETYTATWRSTASPCGIVVRAGTQVNMTGAGSSGKLSPGKEFTGSLGQSEGQTVLLMNFNPGSRPIYMCQNGYSRECGA